VTNTTEEYWDVDGTSLHTYAWNIETLGGRLNVPLLRGEDITVPYNPGEVWRQKMPGSRVLSLAMWVKDSDEAGTEPTLAADHRVVFNENWDTLVRLFFSRTRQLVLTRRQEFDAGYLVSTAHAELASDMSVAMIGRMAGTFVVDLKLADPYFYADPTTTPIAAGAGPVAINNPGHDGVVKMNVRFNGPLDNPVLVNTATDPDVSVSYVGSIALGDYVDLDTGFFQANDQDAANVIAAVEHDGSRRWMELVRGLNSLELTADSGAGSVDLTFQAPYF
jgi:hypothetical protein